MPDLPANLKDWIQVAVPIATVSLILISAIAAWWKGYRIAFFKSYLNVSLSVEYIGGTIPFPTDGVNAGDKTLFVARMTVENGSNVAVEHFSAHLIVFSKMFNITPELIPHDTLTLFHIEASSALSQPGAIATRVFTNDFRLAPKEIIQSEAVLTCDPGMFHSIVLFADNTEHSKLHQYLLDPDNEEGLDGFTHEVILPPLGWGTEKSAATPAPLS